MQKQSEITGVRKGETVNFKSANKKVDRSIPNQLGVIVVGAGFVSGGYIDYFRQSPNTRLVAIVDSNPDILNKWSKESSTVQLIEDYKEAMKLKGVDVVVICTPHNLHHEMVTRALRSGKDVICEKPIAISLKEADSMINTAQEEGRKLLVTLNMRFDSWAYKIKKLIDEQKIGHIFMARSAYLGYEVQRLNDPHHWKGDIQRAGGGVLLDGGYHIVDLMNSYLGRAKYVQANGGRSVVTAPNKGEDNCSLIIEYESGAIATLISSFTACGPDCHKEPTLGLYHDFYGTEGTISCQSSYDSVRESKQELELLSANNGLQKIDLTDADGPDFYDHFVDYLQGKGRLIVTAIDARNTSAVVEAAYQSIQAGQKIPVDWRIS
jgi:predicted dehydrogenase